MQPAPRSRVRPVLSRRDVLAILAGSVTLACASGPAQASRRADAAAAERDDVAGFLELVRAGDRAGVERRLEADASLARATDERGRSAFVLAHVHGHADVAALLRARGLELDVVEAVLAQDWERVEALAGADPAVMNRAHPIGGNPLYASGLCGGVQQYRLRALGCDSDGRPPGGSGHTPGRAAMDCVDPIGAWLAATDLLSNGGDVNAPQAGGESILHGAVRARDERLVRLALRKGARTGALDDEGRTPLALAQSLEWERGVALLRAPDGVARDCRASRFAFDANREPFTLLPLDDVPQKAQSEMTGVSHFDRARVQELLAADPRLVNAISTDAELAIEACGHTGAREIIRMHLDRGAPLSLPTAISLGDLAHARWLLERDPRLVHERGPHDFALFWYPAIGKGSVEAAELLLEFGIDLEQESGGETGLHVAAMRGQVDLVRFLVERGADVTAVGYRQVRTGATPRGLARREGNDEVETLLARLGAPA